MAVFINGILFGKFIKCIPIVNKVKRWSIGIYIGESPFNLSPPENIKNLTLSAKDVVDVTANFVADPFMIHENGRWYIFFEVMNAKTKQGDIELVISNDGLNGNISKLHLMRLFIYLIHTSLNRKINIL